MSSIPSSAAEIAREFLDGTRLEHVLGLRFGDCSLALETNSPALVAKLREYYSDFLAPEEGAHLRVQALEAPAPKMYLPLTLKEPEPGKTKIKEEYHDLPDGRLVRKRLTGMVFVFGPKCHLGVGPCLANDNQVVNFINSRYIQWMLDQGHLLCHAAAVTDRKGGLALAGLSGRGKSTLALHIMSLGLDFVSNDRLLISRQATGALRMGGVAKLPRINPGTALNNPNLASVIPPEDRQRFKDLPPNELWSLEHKYDAYLDRCFGPGRFVLDSAMTGLVILTWLPGAGDFRLEPVDLAQRPDLLAAFTKSPGLFFLPPDGHGLDHSDAAYLRVLDGCPVYELAGGADFTAAAQACLKLL